MLKVKNISRWWRFVIIKKGNRGKKVYWRCWNSRSIKRKTFGEGRKQRERLELVPGCVESFLCTNPIC